MGSFRWTIFSYPTHIWIIIAFDKTNIVNIFMFDSVSKLFDLISSFNKIIQDIFEHLILQAFHGESTILLDIY